MERIPLLHTIKEIQNLPNNSTIYFGHEFCFYMLPKLREIDKFISLVKGKNIMFSFVTPYVNELNLLTVESILKKLDKNFPGIEVIVNDWGIFNYIKNNFKFDIVLGRLLTKQKRGFFLKHHNKIIKIENFKLSKNDKKYLRSSILDNSYLVQFLIENNIKRIGIDNLILGINKNAASIKVDLYYPYCYLTTSNYCRTYLIKTNKAKYERTLHECPRYCLNEKRVIQIADRNIILKGNTQFYSNRKKPKNIGELNVDRIIITKL